MSTSQLRMFAGSLYIINYCMYCVLGIEIGMKESLEKLKEIIGRLRLKEGIPVLLL